jgi:hypothetical protein
MSILSNYSDGFFNVSAAHGFLPVKAPMVKLPSNYADLQAVLDNMPVVLNETEFGYLNTEDGIVAPTLAIKNHVAAVEKEEDIFVLQALFRSYSYLLMTIGCLISSLTVKLKFFLFLCKLLAQCQAEYLGLFTLFINLNFSSYYFRISRNFGC